MKTGNFIDYVKLHVQSGDGGKGSAHLRREKYVEKGGPDGGDGGKGGDVILKGNKDLWTLYEFNFKKHIRADHGENGQKQKKTGAAGENVIIEVPLGTVIRETESEKIIGEIIEHDEEFIVAEGGKGGRGNCHFKSSTRQTPRYAQPGIPGKERNITLELKILADVGLVGFPNAGKSTLLSSITAAKPKIDNYPFTTLKPSLGIVQNRINQTFVMADIPGIIKGAAEGKGLGFRFLRHIERNSTLLFVIPSDTHNIKKEYEILVDELRRYNPELLDKDRLVAISKCDLLDEELTTEMNKELQKDFKDTDYLMISSVSQQGLQQLKDQLWKILNKPVQQH